MGAWGTGLYDDDEALDVRGLWRDLIAIGLPPPEATRRVLQEMEMSPGADDTVAWLALADLQWSCGWLQPAVRARALRIVRTGSDLESWEDRDDREQRRRVLERLARRLRSPMPARRAVRPRHPCDWRPGEHIVWRTASGGWAALRVMRFDAAWGGGGSPIVELVDAGDGRVVPPAAKLANRAARTAARSVPTTKGRRWRGGRFQPGVFGPGQFSARRLTRLSPARGARRGRGVGGAVLRIPWSMIDNLLFNAFEVPWALGAILRVPTAGAPLFLAVVDVRQENGQALTVAEPLEGDATSDVWRTADTARRVHARVIDPGFRQSLGRLQRQLGVRTPDERAPVLVSLLGYAPAGTAVVGKRRVVTPSSIGNVIDWSELPAFVASLTTRTP